MAIITFIEIINLAIMILVLGFIFMGLFPRRPRTIYDRMHPKRFRIDDFWFAVLISAPAVVLHELAHKFVALGFGFSASFELFFWGLVLGIFLRLINSPFLIIAPGYVTIGQETFRNDLAYRLIAFAGPLINLVIWLIAYLVIKYNGKNLSRGQLSFWMLTRNINLILFIFNMIPFGPLDGSKVIFGAPSI